MDYEQKPDPMLLGLITGMEVRNWMNKGPISNTRPDDQIGQNSIKNAKNGSTNLVNPSPVPSFNNWTNKGQFSHTRPENQISQNSTKNEPWPSSTNPQSFVSASNAWIGTKEPAKAPFPHKTRPPKFTTNNQAHVKLMTPKSTTPARPCSWLKRAATHNEEFLPSKDKKMKKIEETHFCELCQISCSGPVVMQQHLIGRQHKAKMEYRKLKRGGTIKGNGKGKPMCDVCEIWCSDKDALQMHFKGQKHKAKVKEVEACRENGGQKCKISLVMCELCHVPCMNEELYQMHLKGKQHAWEELKRKEMTVWGWV